MKQMRRLKKRQRSIDMEQKKYKFTKETNGTEKTNR